MATNSDAKSLFLSLTGGLKFNNKKYKTDIEKFKSGTVSRVGDVVITDSSKQNNQHSHMNNTKLSSFIPVNNLDFFGNSNHTSTTTTATTTTTTNESSDHDENESSDDEDESEADDNTTTNNNNSSNSDDDDDGSDDDDDEQESVNNNNNNNTHHQRNTLTHDEIQQLRKKHKIYVRGTDPIPCPIEHFSQLKTIVRPYLLKNIQQEYMNPTPVQMQTLGILIPPPVSSSSQQTAVSSSSSSSLKNKQRELLVSAPTGSGKTASFVIPILHDLKAPEKTIGFRAVVIAPTRVLAEQIYQVFLTFARGKSWSIKCVTDESLNKLREQLTSLKNDILVATPLKLITLIREGIVSMAHVQRLVFDEADRLFDMGFAEQIDEVLSACTHPQLRKLLFSATIPLGVEQLASTILNDPIRISIGVKNSGAETIEQKLEFCGTDAGKLLALRSRIRQGLRPPVLIFVQSIDRARQLYNELLYDQYSVDYIHGGRSENQTRQVVNNFRLGKIWALISTDVMARGLDFKGVSCVINYDFPVSIVSYIHRIGRTGRAGQQGEAITYFTYDDIPLLKNIANVMRKSGCEVPEWMLHMKKVSSKELANTVIKQATENKRGRFAHSKFKKDNKKPTQPRDTTSKQQQQKKHKRQERPASSTEESKRKNKKPRTK